MDVNQIGTMVRAIRIVRGFNQAELAERSAVDPAYVSRLERGLMVLPDKYMMKLETALGVTFDAVRPSYEAFVRAVLIDPVPGSASGDGNQEE